MLAIDLVQRIRTVSPAAANAVMTRALPTIIPMCAGLGITVEEVTAGRAVASLPLKRRTRNHVGSVYFGAQMTLAELTLGLLLFTLYPPGPYGMLVKRVESDFLTKAKGRLRATCAPPADVLAALAEVNSSTAGKSEAWVPVALTDVATGQEVSRARFLASLKRFDRKG